MAKSIDDKKKDAVVALADHVVNFKQEDIPPQMTQAVKASILNTLGIAMASTTTRPANKKLINLFQEFGGKTESTIIGSDYKAPCYVAAAVNSMQAKSLNLQERHVLSMGYPGPAAFSTALAVAERIGRVDGKEFITAYALGLDIMARIGGAVIAREMFNRGWLVTQMLEYVSNHLSR